MGAELLSAGAGWWGMTFRKMPSLSFANGCCHPGKQVYNSNDKETRSRERLLIKPILPVMVQENQGHDISAGEKSRLLPKCEHSLL